MDRQQLDRVTIKDARLVFRNFSGKEGTFNAEGQRNFCVLLTEEMADDLKRRGWNVRFLKPREEGDLPQPYVQISVKYRGRDGKMLRPPRVVLITSKDGKDRRTELGEGEVSLLDWADIRHVDLMINPRPWTNAAGAGGIKAYLYSIYVTINQDELEEKYMDVPDSGQSATGFQREDPPWDED